MHRRILLLLSFTAFFACAAKPPARTLTSGELYACASSQKGVCQADFGSLAEPEKEHPLGKKWRDWFIRSNVEGTVTIGVLRYDSDKGLTDSSGSGVIVGRTGIILTAYHVVERARFITAAPRRMAADGSVSWQRRFEVRVLAFSKEKDVALLGPIDIQELPTTMPRLGEAKPPTPGQRVWNFGQRTGWSYGVVTEVAHPTGRGPVIRTVIELDFGDSGGPLVSEDGRILGILVFLDGKRGQYGDYMPIGAALEALKTESAE